MEKALQESMKDFNNKEKKKGNGDATRERSPLSDLDTNAKEEEHSEPECVGHDSFDELTSASVDKKKPAFKFQVRIWTY